MAVQFTVETGTGSSSSTSYITVAEYAQFLEDAGLVDPCTTEIERQTALNRMTEVLDSFAVWQGYRYSDSQALEWPREEAYYNDGVWIDSASIPREIKKALAFMVYYHKSGTDVIPVRDTAAVKSESSAVSGAVSESKEYWYSDKITPEISEIKMILRRILPKKSMALNLKR